MGAKSIENTMECVKPLWISIEVSVSVNNGANESRSGIVPAMAPYSIALFPTFLPRTASPMAAPRTIWVRESI